MSVQEVVDHAVEYACGSLLAEYSSEKLTREMLDSRIVEDGGWFNHSGLLEPPEGRMHSVAYHVEDNYVTLVRPGRERAHDLRLGMSEPARSIRFRDETGQNINPLDLCIRISDRRSWKPFVYVAARGVLYGVTVPNNANMMDRPRVTEAVVYAIEDEEALEVAFTAVRAVLAAPIAVRGINRDKWIMQGVIDQGVTGMSLRNAEKAFWELSQTLEANAPEPPKTHPEFPGATLIGYGYEWVVYLQPDGKTVVKVPRDLFPEVSKPGYLFAAKDAYDACNEYIPEFTAQTKFYRWGEMNRLDQDFLEGINANSVNPAKLTVGQLKRFHAFGEGLLSMLEQLDWFPDLWLVRNDDGLWHMKNVVIVDGSPVLCDFTAIYDDYRLSPERTKVEKAQTIEL